MNKIVSWKGKQIENLSRAELVEALQITAEMLESARADATRERNFLAGLRNKTGNYYD